MRLAVGMALVGLALAVGAPPAMACGPDTDCMVGDRTYRIWLPEGDGPFGAVVFMHGYRGTAEGTMRNTGLRQMAQELGVALIAAKSGAEDWLIRNAPRKGFRDDSRELRYFDALLDDVSERFAVDTDRVLATGFSAGGMMTWTLACHRAEKFAAFVPIAGTFWAPMPVSCANPPVRLVHINGTADEVVPIAGRPIADVRQGNSRDAMGMFLEKGEFSRPTPTRDGDAVGLACDQATAPADVTMMYCTHPGGHIMKADWIAWAWNGLVDPS